MNNWELQNTSGLECRLLDTVLETTEKGKADLKPAADLKSRKDGAMFVIKEHKRDWNVTRNSVGMNIGLSGTRKIKNALRLFSTRSQRKYTRVQFRFYAVHYTENIRSIEVTDTKPTQPHNK